MAEQTNWREDTLIRDRVMELVVLVLAMIGITSICYMMYIVVTGESGTKGITKEYTSKSGTKRTAKKSREQHIV